jgi:hypothetical protein
MGEVDKNDVQNICWKAIFIAIALLAIGAVFGHVMTIKCCPMMVGPWGGGPGMKACWDRGDRECKGAWEHKFEGGKEIRGEQKGWFGHKAEMGKCKPGSMKEASLSEPDKASCPMIEKKAGKPKKE